MGAPAAARRTSRGPRSARPSRVAESPRAAFRARREHEAAGDPGWRDCGEMQSDARVPSLGGGWRAGGDQREAVLVNLVKAFSPF